MLQINLHRCTIFTTFAGASSMYSMKRLIYLAIIGSLVALSACSDKDDEPRYDGGTDAVVPVKMLDPIAGCLNGIFSVSATERVHFSRGNLQYQASTNTWRFATNQYDFVGDATDGNVKVGNTKCDNAKISDTYNGWIDLFGWGTGSNPTNSSTTISEYGTFDDWGANKIYNGGDAVNQWRTLTGDECTYLFHGRANAEKLCGMGKVNGVKGVILLPDDWTLPNGVTFNDCTSKQMIWRSSIGRYDDSNQNTDHFSDNTYSIYQWTKMETAGAVFFPLAGYRDGLTIKHLGEIGWYWTRTADNKLRTFVYQNYHITPVFAQVNYCGLAVRLVR